MSGHDVADAIIDRHRADELELFVAWIDASLSAKATQGETLTLFEVDLAKRAAKLLETQAEPLPRS